MKVGFIKPVHQAEWIANIVHVAKKDRNIRMCVDFGDLNKAYHKDDFLLSYIDVLVDNTVGSVLMSFINSFSRYNQIKMASTDMAKTIFTTEWGVFCYTVMPFGLTNSGVTYQRMATTLLHNMMHNKVEVYADDMIVNSKDRGDHITNLKKLFKRIKEYRLRLNPYKCTFGVTFEKLLGFLVSDKGIEVDPSKIKAILDMPPPKKEKEIRGFLGWLQYINQFMTKLTSTCEPIFKLLRKNEPHTWNDECQKAFELIKEYHLHLPVLVHLEFGKPLLLYLSIIEDAIGSMLAQKDDDKNKRVVYHLSKRFHDYETRYAPIEKSCFALVWAIQKLRNIILPFQVWIVARMDPLQYLFKKTALSGRLPRWLILLAKFDVKYVARKTIKGSIMLDFCAKNPIEGGSGREHFLDEKILDIELAGRKCILMEQ